MNSYTNIADAAADVYRLRAELTAQQDAAKKERERLTAAIERAQAAVNAAASGLGLDMIELAETVIYVDGEYAKGGEDRRSVVDDAIKALANGVPTINGNMWTEFFGTKDYAQWHGQRSDHGYGYCPRHGSIIFSIGLREAIRKRDPRELTTEERNACVYYLTNLERIQAARKAAKAAA